MIYLYEHGNNKTQQSDKGLNYLQKTMHLGKKKGKIFLIIFVMVGNRR